MSSFQVGDTVEINDGRIAVVRFCGPTHFATGEWVGVELEDLSGKNDGSVKDVYYFECEMGRGMFLRPAALTLVKSVASQSARAAPGVAGRGTSVVDGAGGPPAGVGGVGGVKKPARPSSMIAPAAGRRTANVSDPAAKRMSMNSASPSPAPARGLTRPASITRVSPMSFLLSSHSWED